MSKPFDFDAALVRRQTRLGNFIAVGAPSVIIANEARLYRKAFHRCGDFRLAWIDLGTAVRWKWDTVKLDVHTAWLRLLGYSDPEIQAILFPYEDET